MPISTVLFLACLTALKWLCFAAGGLMLALAARAHFDPRLQIPVDRGLIGAGIFLATGIAIGVMRRAIARRTGMDRRISRD